MIPYEDLSRLNQPFLEGYKQALDKVLERGRFILGSEVEKFESDFAAYCQVSHCVGVGNGSDALMLALKAFEFKPEDEVILPSNTYIATVLAVINCGLKPVLVEPDIQTYNINPSRIPEAISDRTVAIMPVHLYGKCCDMDAIITIAQENDLRIIEDCAQSHGARYKNKTAGSFGNVSAFSFYPTKNLGALGDGGCVTTNEKELSTRIASIRNYGSLKKYHNDFIGVNSRLDELQAAFLSVKLKSLDEINNHKRKLAVVYQEELSEKYIKPVITEDREDVFHIYTIRHPDRDNLRNFLLRNGVVTEIHYPVPPYRQKALENFFEPDLYPLSDEIHRTTLSLPISLIHTEEDIRKVVDLLNDY